MIRGKATNGRNKYELRHGTLVCFVDLAGFGRPSTRPCIVEVVNYDRRTRVTTVDIIIREGKNRQIRRMFEGIGHDVKSITRVSHGPIRIKNLRPGEWRELEQVGGACGGRPPMPERRGDCRISRSLSPFFAV